VNHSGVPTATSAEWPSFTCSPTDGVIARGASSSRIMARNWTLECNACASAGYTYHTASPWTARITKAAATISFFMAGRLRYFSRIWAAQRPRVASPALVMGLAGSLTAGAVLVEQKTPMPG